MEKWTDNKRAEFGSLLRQIIGNTTGKNFSKISGVDQSRLSRLVNAKENCAPSIKTIDKMMRGEDTVNGVTRDQLLVAAGRMKNSNVQRVVVERSDVYRTFYRRQLVNQYLAAILSVAVRTWGCMPNNKKRSNFALCLEIVNSEFEWFFLVNATDQNASIERTYIRRFAGMIAEYPISNNTKYTYFTTNSELFLQYYNMDMPAIPALNANVSILYLDEETMTFAEHILAETIDPSDDVLKHHF